MSPSPQLAPAGSSSYDSNTMSVGDGTWDSSRNTFLLPNLVGLNFETMRYNGMGNRFRELSEYHAIIRAHGIIAAITFLLVVPTAILANRFYKKDARRALQIHIWLQIITALLVTVIFALGTFAVGPSRRLTNPHHGIGTAIFVLVLIQFILGWWMHRTHKGKYSHEPLKVTLHHWFGRAIALLGIAQVALGLTLYGSPLFLFILYAVAVFLLLVVYFWLTRRHERYYQGSDYGSRYDYGEESVVDERRRRNGSGGWLKPALAGVGAYAVYNKFRRRSRSRDRSEVSRPEVVGSRRHSGSHMDDEKYSQYSDDNERDRRREQKFERILGPIGLASLVYWWFDRKNRTRGDRDSDVSDYGPPLGGATPIHDGRYAGNRPLPSGGPLPPGAPIPQGEPMPPGPGPYGQGIPAQSGPMPPIQPLPSNHHPLNRTHSRTTSMTSETSIISASGEVRRTHGLRDGLATLGVVGLVKSIFNRRRSQREDRRLQEQEDLGLAGPISGNGRPLRRHRQGMSSVSSETSLTAPHPATAHGIPAIPAGTYATPIGGAAATEAERERERRRQEALPLGGVPRPIDMPQIPPDPQGLFHPESTGSESYSSAGRRGHHRHHTPRTAPLPAGTSMPPAAVASSSRQNIQERPQSASAGEDSGVTSPPVSVRVKMHKDGRHVTLSRLPEAEAEARRMRNRRHRSNSASSLSGDGNSNHFRRRDAQQRENDEAMRIESERLAAARNQAQNPNTLLPMNMPPPPPIPESSSAMRPPAGGSVGSPGNYETDVSTEYANNRRRRRAERAQAKQAKEEREARTGKAVGFE